MGKRSNFKRRPQDKYYTPQAAVEPLIPHLPETARYAEPCAGDGALIKHLACAAPGLTCAGAWDIAPEGEGVMEADALRQALPAGTDLIITNPPWSRDALHLMITHFRLQAPAWLLFDAGWMHTKQAAWHLLYCEAIVSVGRVSWMGNGKGGMDDCCWYLFGAKQTPTRLFGRALASRGGA